MKAQEFSHIARTAFLDFIDLDGVYGRHEDIYNSKEELVHAYIYHNNEKLIEKIDKLIDTWLSKQKGEFILGLLVCCKKNIDSDLDYFITNCPEELEITEESL